MGRFTGTWNLINYTRVFEYVVLQVLNMYIIIIITSRGDDFKINSPCKQLFTLISWLPLLSLGVAHIEVYCRNTFLV